MLHNFNNKCLVDDFLKQFPQVKLLYLCPIEHRMSLDFQVHYGFRKFAEVRDYRLHGLNLVSDTMVTNNQIQHKLLQNHASRKMSPAFSFFETRIETVASKRPMVNRSKEQVKNVQCGGRVVSQLPFH